MELEASIKPKKRFIKRSTLKRIIISVICIAALAAGFFVVKAKFFSSSKATNVQKRLSRVTKGNVSVSITGSGPIVSSNESDVTSAVAGKITKIYHKEGDTVKAGEILFELDDSDAKLNVEKIKNSISQAQLSMKTTSKNISNLTLNAPFDGQVKNVADIKIGDEVNKGTTVLTITDVSKLKLKVLFNGAIIKNIKVGQKVNVNVQDLMQSVDGTITYIDSKPSTGSDGTVYEATVSINNPGALKADMVASVEVDTNNGTHSSTNAGKLEYYKTQTVKTNSSGTVSMFDIKENEFVKAGQTIIKLENDDLEITTQTNDLKIQDLQNQLATAEKQLKEYKIYAPIDGIIVLQDVEVGTSVKSADILTTISDIGRMEFEVSIDELDIYKIKLGQKVNVTVDALEETNTKPISGEISKIAMEGKSTNGVSTYPVIVKINETDNLKVGMNANAEIIIEEKTDVLTVPLEAITTMGDRSFVRVLSNGTAQGDMQRDPGGAPGDIPEGRPGGGPDGGPGGDNKNGAPDMTKENSAGGQNRNPSGNSRQNRPNSQSGNRKENSTTQYYANTIMKTVEIGINDGENIEIKSGLTEGEQVVLPPLVTSTTTQTTQQMGGMMGGGMMGGMMGGPGGGAPPNMGGGQRSNQRSNSSNRSR